MAEVMEIDAGKTGAGSHDRPAQSCDIRIRRRSEARQDIDTCAVIRLVDLAADVHGRILDISTGGCRIRTDRPFPVGIFRRVETEFRIEGLPFRLAGVTQAVYDPLNVGIRFLDTSERKREQLLQLIEEIKTHKEVCHEPEGANCGEGPGD